MELRKGLREIMMVNMMKVAAIEKRTIYHLFRKHMTIVRQTISCRMVTASRYQVGLLMRVKDGTCSQVVIVKYNRGYDTITEEETGNKKRCLAEE